MGTTNTLDLNNRVTNLEKAASGGDSAQANKADIATEFSVTTDYTAGCFVYYGGKLYQFNTDHAAGAWDHTDVVEANVTDQVVSNATAIAVKVDEFTNTDSFYGTCSTAADVAEKIIALEDANNFSLRAGVTITVNFDNDNTAGNVTLNVNNTGAKGIWFDKAVITTTGIATGVKNRPVRYTYDGTYWVWMGQSIDSNTTYNSMTVAELVAGLSTTQRTVRADYLKDGIEQLIDEKVPDAPTTDGAYSLKATVVSGVPTYSWVSD